MNDLKAAQNKLRGKQKKSNSPDRNNASTSEEKDDLLLPSLSLESKEPESKQLELESTSMEVKKIEQEESKALVVLDDNHSVVSMDHDNQSITSLTTVKSTQSQVSKASKSSKHSGRYKLPTTTTLIFQDTDGSKEERPLTIRLLTYSELQREISRLTPKQTNLYVIQNEIGERIDATNFKPMDVIVVRKLLHQPPPLSFAKGLGAKWELEAYHEAEYKRMMKNEDDKPSVSLFF